VIHQTIYETVMNDGNPNLSREERDALANLAAIDVMLNAGARFGGPDGLMADYMGDTYFLRWATDAVLANPTTIDHPELGAINTDDLGINRDLAFSPEQHRRAMGIAIIFHNHGYSFSEYMEYMNATWEADVPPAIHDVLHDDE
jgi:hypothetical protein